MFGHSAYALFSLTLALSVVACVPKGPGESASDTEEPSTSDTTGMTTGMTTVMTTGMTTDATETGMTDTGATAGETAGDACPASDPAVTASVTLGLGEWPLLPDVYPERIEIAAECSVEAATSVGGAIELQLKCSEGELVDMPISVNVTGPADFGVDLVAGDGVELAAMWEGDAVDYVGGVWFTLHDKGGELLLAGLDYHGAGDPKDALAPLSVVSVDGVCEPTCENGCTTPEWDMVERLALDFSHSDGTKVQVVDDSRAQLITGGRRFDIVVAQAELRSCINCGEDYLWLVRQADQE